MGLEIQDGLVAVDGSTFGNLLHDGSVLKLMNSHGKTVVDIPLQCVSSANLVDGREIVLEMHKYDESRTDECLMDVRFVLGTEETALKQAKETHDSILELANLRSPISRWLFQALAANSVLICIRIFSRSKTKAENSTRMSHMTIFRTCLC
jgi:hypothetical protein